MTRPKRQADFDQFLKVLRRRGRPDHLPFYEHIASPQFIARRTNTRFDELTVDDPAYWPIYVNFWLDLGFDCVPMEVLPAFPDPQAQHKDDAGAASHGSDERAVIRTMEDFETYPWPGPYDDPIMFSHFDTVAGLLPEGVKIVGGVCGGPYEWTSTLMGVQGLSYALYDQPQLVEAMFAMMRRIHVDAVRQLATLDAIGALRQGDDLGYKTSTFLAPDLLRRHVFPIYTEMTAAAHAHDKPFILHSCGNLARVYDDLIDDCRIDAKHSFEETIMPVDEFKAQYGQRITPLGGIDVDLVCRGDEHELRACVRDKIERCFGDGHWALGTGNSLTDYMPVDHYLIVLDEAIRIAG